MKKFSNFLAILGAVSLLWMAYTVVHYGAVNMRRIDTQAYAWKLEHYGP